MGCGTSLTVVALRNVTVWGSGSKPHCTQPCPVDVAWGGWGGYAGFASIGPGSTPDGNKPSTLFPRDSSVTFENSLVESNPANASPCGGSVEFRAVDSFRLNLARRIPKRGQSITCPPREDPTAAGRSPSLRVREVSGAFRGSQLTRKTISAWPFGTLRDESRRLSFHRNEPGSGSPAATPGVTPSAPWVLTRL